MSNQGIYPSSTYPSTAQSVPALSTPAFDPQSQQINLLQQQLSSQTSADEIANLQVSAQNQALQTAKSLETSVQNTMHTLANQAETTATQFVGDEVAQVKKGADVSGKAV